MLPSSPRGPSGRIALAQIDTTVGDFAGNAARIRACTALARDGGRARWWSSRSWRICGYPPRDFLDMPEFVDRCAARARGARPAGRVVARRRGRLRLPRDGRRGAAARALQRRRARRRTGGVAAVGRKSLLPTYDVFDETRYFLPAPLEHRRAGAGRRALALGLSVCEDIWNDKRFWDRPRYDARPHRRPRRRRRASSS